MKPKKINLTPIEKCAAEYAEWLKARNEKKPKVVCHITNDQIKKILETK